MLIAIQLLMVRIGVCTRISGPKRTTREDLSYVELPALGVVVKLRLHPQERVHIDQTYEASVNRVREHLRDDADRLLSSRVRLINVWRPIGNPVAHKPLAVSDWRYVDTSKDLIPVRLIYPQRAGSNYSVKYNPEHKWYYLSNQTPDEVILIKCFDSEVDRARLTPHTAFVDTTSPADAPQRQSIEVRALVFDAE